MCNFTLVLRFITDTQLVSVFEVDQDLQRGWRREGREIQNQIDESVTLMVANYDALRGKPPTCDLIVLNFHIVGCRLPFPFF